MLDPSSVALVSSFPPPDTAVVPNVVDDGLPVGDWGQDVALPRSIVHAWFVRHVILFTSKTFTVLNKFLLCELKFIRTILFPKFTSSSSAISG